VKVTDFIDAKPLSRTTDPVTSEIAAKRQAHRATHLTRVLEAYVSAELTDVEAATIAGLDRYETTRRASELRNAGLIEAVTDRKGRLVTRLLPTKRVGMVCRITALGREALT
jgi:CRP-like cAMP-binding protein